MKLENITEKLEYTFAFHSFVGSFMFIYSIAKKNREEYAKHIYIYILYTFEKWNHQQKHLLCNILPNESNAIDNACIGYFMRRMKSLLSERCWFLVMLKSIKTVEWAFNRP